MTKHPPTLPVREAYRLWAERYEVETVVSALENRVVESLMSGFAADVLLDAGCGTGRRIAPRPSTIARAVGVDLVSTMLEAGRRNDPSRTSLVAADVRSLPFRTEAFDLVWCRLVVGHLSKLDRVYRELRRVARTNGRLFVSDFHAAAAAAGHARTFRDGVGLLHAIEHHVHTLADHRRAAERAGWSLLEAIDASPGDPERPFYDRAGRGEQFVRERTLPLVLVLCFSA